MNEKRNLIINIDAEFKPLDYTIVVGDTFVVGFEQTIMDETGKVIHGTQAIVVRGEEMCHGMTVAEAKHHYLGIPFEVIA